MSNAWINLDKYDGLNLLIFGIGCLLWVFVYFIYIRNIFKYKWVEMPLIAACSNFGWEGVWGFGMLMAAADKSPLFTNDMGLLFVWGYRVWFILDIFLIYFVIKYAARHMFVEELKKHAKPITLAFLVFFSAAYYAFTGGGLDTPVGANSAYIAQVLLSVLYINLIVHKKSVHDLSYAVGWLRTLGTGGTTAFMFLTTTDASNTYVRICCAFALIVDIVFLVIFTKRRAAERAAAGRPEQSQ